MIINKLIDTVLYSLTVNPVIKHSIKIITIKCDKCNSTVLEQIINDIETGNKSKLCKRCFILFHFYKIWPPIMGLFGFAVSRKSLKTVPTFTGGYSLSAYTKGAHSLLEGIYLFGLKKPIVCSSPISAVLELTRFCNLNCSYCYVKTLNPNSNNIGKASDMSTEMWLKSIDNLRESGVLSIVLSGGEPLLRKDIFTIASYANQHDIATTLATNGTLIDKDMAQRIKESGIEYVEISIFSSIEEINDAHREKNSFNKSINAVRYCKEQGITVGFAMTITSLVKNEVKSFLELGKKLGVDICIFLNYVPSGNADDPMIITNKDKEELLREILSKRKEYDKYFRKIVVLQSPDISQLHYEKQEYSELMQIGFTKFNKPGWGKYLKYVGGCSAGRFIIAISNKGTIMPCPFLRIKLGNILKDDFNQIWKTDTILNQMRDRKNWEGKCGKCKYKVICGGCRARSYIKSNNVLGEDPSCSYST